jgi:DNA invertase Pin-like site-specific DNA recombinase
VAWLVDLGDGGISGARGRDKRPGLDALLKGVARREFDIVAAWSVCRLGPSLRDLIGLLDEATSPWTRRRTADRTCRRPA